MATIGYFLDCQWFHGLFAAEKPEERDCNQQKKNYFQ
jgi:hypothetical protein